MNPLPMPPSMPAPMARQDATLAAAAPPRGRRLLHRALPVLGWTAALLLALAALALLTGWAVVEHLSTGPGVQVVVDGEAVDFDDWIATGHPLAALAVGVALLVVGTVVPLAVGAALALALAAVSLGLGAVVAALGLALVVVLSPLWVPALLVAWLARRGSRRAPPPDGRPALAARIAPAATPGTGDRA